MGRGVGRAGRAARREGRDVRGGGFVRGGKGEAVVIPIGGRDLVSHAADRLSELLREGQRWVRGFWIVAAGEPLQGRAALDEGPAAVVVG
jgi:hypothetical protein